MKPYKVVFTNAANSCRQLSISLSGYKEEDMTPVSPQAVVDRVPRVPVFSFYLLHDFLSSALGSTTRFKS